MKWENNASFRSFKIIQKELPDLSTTVSNLHLYYGHTPSPSSATIQPEALQDHIDLVNQTALHLIKIHGLETVINRLIEEICDQLEMRFETEGNFIKELFLASISFHDYGKLNENFQANRLENEYFSKVQLQIGSQHSILSAYLFLNHFLHKLETLDSTFINVLAGIICAFSDPILKHHSSTFDIGDIDSEKCEELNRFLPLIGKQSTSAFLAPILNQKKTAVEEIYMDSKRPESYPLFSLLKLNFSLLTAADYLATLCYQYDTELPATDEGIWWGIFSSERKNKLYKQFKNSASYNRSALEEPEKLIRQPMHSFNQRSAENLNYLRSRMLGEVILNLRQHKEEKLFYLKAPTGGGKTNISLASAIELLQCDEKINKIFYVFPFTTLITQTYSTVKESLQISADEIVQLHSKAEWNLKNYADQMDGLYKEEWLNHVDNLFVQYPFVLLSHVRFFDILKGNRKESNYLLHRLANSVVIIDELQSYNPKFWDHVNYFITHYAHAFNIRFILMSATLPEIGRLTMQENNNWVELISEPDEYFQNDNFAKRVTFDFTLLEQKFDDEEKYSTLANIVAEKAEEYAKKNSSRAKIIIEFITKKSASDFADVAKKHSSLSQYTLLMMTGTILEPRRNEVKDWLRNTEWLNNNPKVLLVSTQVVEAGVDIDMDIGFKDTSLIDSDEQLAGRVNRNAQKSNNTVYLFNLDREGIVYQNDERLTLQRQELNLDHHKEILEQKDFNLLYNRIIEKHLANRNELIRYFENYLEHLRSLRFTESHRNFQLIEDNTVSLFIPLSLPLKEFSEKEQELLNNLNIQADKKNKISGDELFNSYVQLILNRSDNFIKNRDGLRRIQSLLAKYSISVYPKTAEIIEMMERMDYDQSEPFKYGYLYCSGHQNYYDYQIGLNLPADHKAVDFI